MLVTNAIRIFLLNWLIFNIFLKECNLCCLNIFLWKFISVVIVPVENENHKLAGISEMTIFAQFFVKKNHYYLFSFFTMLEVHKILVDKYWKILALTDLSYEIISMSYSSSRDILEYIFMQEYQRNPYYMYSHSEIFNLFTK